MAALRSTAGLPALAIAAVLAAGCARPASPLRPRESATTAPVSAERHAVGSRGAIGYDSALLGPRLLLSIELGVRFELALRRIDEDGLVEIGRVDLGPPDWDVTGIAAPAAGPLVWVASTDGTVREIDVGARRVARTWRVGQAVTAAAATADGRLLVYGTDRGVICLRRTADGALLQCAHAHRGRVSSLAIDGAALYSATWAGEIARFALPSLRETATASIDGAVLDIAARGDRVVAATASGPPTGDRRRDDLGGALAAIDLGTGQRRRCDGHTGPVGAVAWTAAGDLASGGWDRTIRGWRLDASGCRERWRFAPGGHQITALATGPRGRYLAVSLWVTGLKEPGSLLLRYLYPRAR